MGKRIEKGKEWERSEGNTKGPGIQGKRIEIIPPEI
jgi:hypothetical protein